MLTPPHSCAQVNARADVSVVGGQPMRVTVRAYEREGATWEVLQVSGTEEIERRSKVHV